MTEKHVTYARRRLTSLMTAWRTSIAKAFERQYAEQLQRRHRSASCSHLLAVARPRIGRRDADQPRYGRLLPRSPARRVRQLRRGRRLQPPRLMRVNTQVTFCVTQVTKENRNGSDGSDLPDTEERRGI